jgi:uncharacterized protein DUF4435
MSLTGNLMSSSGGVTPEEAFVERVKAARQGSAVLKARLITLRSDLPDAIVLAFEGDDDKIIYGQWIRRIRPGFRYEPFPCGGKRETRDLKNALSRDLARLGDRVFFLVDRDYDDLRGFKDTDNIYITEMYSVENYLVSDDVLEELLRDEFPCHARPDVRSRIVQLFTTDYGAFLRLMAPVNRRLYIARHLGIALTKRLPTTLRQLITVQIGNIAAIRILPEEVVVCQREPTAEEVLALTESFEELEPKTRHRGKFALKFFREWLERLAVEYLAGETGLFNQKMPEGAIRRAEFVLSNFASKSRFPTGLAAFIDAIE